jgi:hypothetical protein
MMEGEKAKKKAKRTRPWSSYSELPKFFLYRRI